MKLTLAEPKYLKESISIISELVNEAQIRITPNSIELVAMDPANVAMVIFKLLSSCFVEYKVEKDLEIGVNLSNLKQILRRAGPSDMLTLEMADNKLMIQLKGTSIRTFSLPIIELDEKEQKVPELSFNASIKLPSSLLNETIADADVVGESVAFLAEPKMFSVKAEGDLSDANIEIKEDEGIKISISGGDKEIKSKYSIEYLKKMINGHKLADEVSVYFSKDYPLKLEYNSIDRLSLSFILAPRVENE
ncbi:MAG: proliferating cell nuclear antigen (pcna) [Nanoarchaeota archaeon]|nr:proliferating cell nuclear antigen (pcna) [Nanoarchaeota archaeon]